MRLLSSFMIFVCLLGISIYGGQAEPNDIDLNCQETVAAMQALTAKLDDPQILYKANELRCGMKFDPMSYFAILKNVSMPKGKILDYVYQMEPSAGYPVLYVRSREGKPYKNMQEYTKAYPGYMSPEDRMKTLAQSLEIQDSEAGYFEYVVFYFMAPDFYLHKWTGTDKEIVCHEARLLEIFKANARIPADVIGAAKTIKFPPRITFSADQSEVKLITYTAWGGFFEETFAISRSIPPRAHRA